MWNNKHLLLIGCLAIIGTRVGAQAQTANSDKMMAVTSAAGTIVTTDGGKTWQVAMANSADQLRERLAEKISARHREAGAMPTGVTAAFPNPTSGLASISYGMEQPGEVSVTLHDSHGSEVLRANEGPRAAGQHSAQLDTTPLPDGVYFYRIVSGGRIIAGSTMIVSH